MANQNSEDIHSSMNLEKLGLSLKEVASDYIQSEVADVVSRWLHSSLDVDLFFWVDERSQIIKQQLTFCGQVIEWDYIDGLKTGFIVDEDSKDRSSMKASGSELIHFDSQVQWVTVNQGLKVIDSTPALSDKEKQSLISNFTKKDKSSMSALVRAVKNWVKSKK